MAYSLDFRQKVLEAYLAKEGTNQALAERFKISISTVKRIGQRYRATGSVNLYLDKIGHASKIDGRGETALKQKLSQQANATLKDLQRYLKKTCGIEVTEQAIHYVLKKLSISYKKKSLYSSERDSEENKKKEKYLQK